jgi:hypothetical protein
MAQSSDDKELVHRLIQRIAEDGRTTLDESRQRLHRSLCVGTCHWFRTTGREVGFDRLRLDNTEQGRIKALMLEVMGTTDEKQARERIHRVLCGS